MSDFNSDYKQQLSTAVDALFGAPQIGAASRVSRKRRLSVFAAIAIGVLLLAAAAFAAGEIIGIGSPVRPSHGPERSTRSTGIGLPVKGLGDRHRSASLLPISVADPAGGLPWGMRIVTTTRGLVCVQIGRLLDGHLGVLGQDGQFKNDRLFHELPPGAVDQSTCSQPNVIALYRERGLASAWPLPGEIRSCSEQGSPPTESSTLPTCPVRDERTIVFGVLGPHALSVSYRAAGQLHTVKTSGSHGAYLIVLAPSQSHTQVSGGFMAANVAPTEKLPVSVIRGYQLSRVVFGFGDRRCQVAAENQPGGPPACTASMAAAPLAPPISSDIRSRVTLIAHRRVDGYALRLTFIAPVAVHNAGTSYGVQYTMQGSPPCESAEAGQPIERDISRGQRVHVTILVSQRPGCHGVIHGRIILGRQGGALVGPTYDERTVGRFAFNLP